MSIDYNRHHRERVIKRKKDLSNQLYGHDYYRHDGKYSKGKIHCSCDMCSNKTKIHGFSRSDMRKRDSINLQDL